MAYLLNKQSGVALKFELSLNKNIAMSVKRSDRSTVGTNANEDNPIPGFKSQEKSSLGGKYNSGVTSGDPEEKSQIEKKGAAYKKQPGSYNENKKDKKR